MCGLRTMVPPTRRLQSSIDGQATGPRAASISGRDRPTGFANNFRSLLTNPAVDADYVAFCDQDDVWLPAKTREAVAALPRDPSLPGLYCARTIVVDAAGTTIAHSPRFTRPPDFRNALVQNIGGGNTMVMNRAGFELVRAAATLTDFVSHDWFTYLVISGAGGKVVYSEVPHVLYRQHGNNVIGANSSAAARWARLGQLLQGRFRRWNAHNLRGLEVCRELLHSASAGGDVSGSRRRGRGRCWGGWRTSGDRGCIDRASWDRHRCTSPASWAGCKRWHGGHTPERTDHRLPAASRRQRQCASANHLAADYTLDERPWATCH